MRLFLAIELPADMKRHLARMSDVLRAQRLKLSLTRAENLHVTVKFIGEVSDDQVPKLCDALAGISPSGGMWLAIDHLLMFPPRGPVLIVGGGVGGDAEKLVQAHKAIDERCGALGIPRENRQYRPHVTLARARPPLPAWRRETLTQALTPFLPGPGFTATRLALMQSRLTPAGAQYARIAHWPL